MKTIQEIGNKKKLLITGVSGMLGSNLAYYFRDKYRVLGTYNSHPVKIPGVEIGPCNMTVPKNIKPILTQWRPDIIIHCAGMTNVDECEKDKEAAKEINVLATRHLVGQIIHKETKLVYISSDSVYDGVSGNHSEDDVIAPLNYYGLSKYEGEQESLKRENTLVLRTNIFGWNIQEKQSLGEWVLDNLKAGNRIQGFTDAYFSTMYTMEVARVIDCALQVNLTGLYNCGSCDSCSKCEFAFKIAERFGFDQARIKSISIDDFKFVAHRGKRLTMDVSKIQNDLEISIPTICQSIDGFFKDGKIFRDRKSLIFPTLENPGLVDHNFK
ncbi:SDR family oxidoreductase [Thermodesulfobacteriota bacterium]